MNDTAIAADILERLKALVGPKGSIDDEAGKALDIGETVGARLKFGAGRDTVYADAHYHLARALDELERGDEAMTHWQTFLELAPDSPWAEEAQRRLRPEREEPMCAADETWKCCITPPARSTGHRCSVRDAAPLPRPSRPYPADIHPETPLRRRNACRT